METQNIESVKKRRLNRKEKILLITQLAALFAIEVIMCFTPLGTLPIIPGIVDLTIYFVPAIIASIVIGPVAGSIMGFLGGACCFIYYTFVANSSQGSMMYTPFTALPFKSYWSIVVCFVPRILLGLFPGLIYKYGKKTIKNDYVRMGIGCAVGSITNTFLVLFLTYVLWGKKYAQGSDETLIGLLYGFIFLAAVNGTLEAIVSTAVGIPISKALFAIKGNKK